jgi:hypothetical protein
LVVVNKAVKFLVILVVVELVFNGVKVRGVFIENLVVFVSRDMNQLFIFSNDFI